MRSPIALLQTLARMTADAVVPAKLGQQHFATSEPEAFEAMMPAMEALETREHLSAASVPINTFTTGRYVVAADFNRDTITDLAVSTYSSETATWQIGILLGNGDGTFAPGNLIEPIPNGQTATAVPLVAADLDLDGDIDLVAGNSTVYLNTGIGGIFTGGISVTLPGSLSSALVIPGGFERPELLVFETDGGEIAVYGWNGTALVRETTVTSDPNQRLAAAGDINRDSRADILTTSTTNARDATVFFGTFNNTFVMGDSLLGIYSPKLGDINGDGNLDVIGTTDDGAADGIGVVNYVLGNGNGTFMATAVTTISANGITLVADLDGDSKAEVVSSIHSFGGLSYSLTFGELDAGSTTVIYSPGRLTYFAYLLTGQFAGDGRSDLLLGWGSSIGAGPLLNESRATVRETRDASTVGSFVLPTSPVLAGTTYDYFVNNVVFADSASTLRQVFFTIDLNADGVVGEDEPTFEATSLGAGSWKGSYRALDSVVDPGTYRIIARVVDESSSAAIVSPGTITSWYRVYYAEGWRNDATVNEYVPLANPNSVPVDYKIYARYETGERDQLIAQGTIAPNTRGGITVSEVGKAARALVRAGVGYALEVQSALPLSAFFSHYDNLGGQSTATGEALTNLASPYWAFADLSTSRFDYLLFYNPFDSATTITTTFFDTQGSAIPVTFTLEAFRRGGLSLRDLPQLTGATAFAASVMSSAGPILAVQTSYSPTTGEGFTTVGQLQRSAEGNATTITLPNFEVGTTGVPTIVLFNPGDAAQSITITTTFDTNTAPVEQTVVLQAHERFTFNPIATPTTGSSFATVRLASNARFFAQASTSDLTRTDSTATAPPTLAADTWAFADCFMDRALAGIKFFETLRLYNFGEVTSTMTVRYLFGDGTQSVSTHEVGAGKSMKIDMHLEAAVLGHAPATWYSIVVTGTQKLIANLSHWDLLLGGGWESGGTPLGNTQQLA